MNENVMLEKRNIHIDAIKGWSCILVVVGHAIFTSIQSRIVFSYMN